MFPQGRAAAHPVGSILLEYAWNGCPVDVGRNWSRVEIMAAAERGPHISALVPEAIAMMHEEVEANVKEGFATAVYLDEIEHLLELDEWAELKISPSAMVLHRSRQFRTILDFSFKLRLFGMKIPLVNDETVITAPSTEFTA